MFEKNMRLAYLLDFYGDALDDRTKSIMQSYYEDDLSLAEIAEGERISRQGVRHIIKKAEETLEFFEDKFGLAKQRDNFETVIEKLEKTKSFLERENEDKFKEPIRELSEIISILNNKGF